MKTARLIFLLLVFSALPPVRAQTPPLLPSAARPPVAKPYTLVDALSGRNTSEGVVLVVNAKWIRLPPDAIPPKSDSSLNQIAAAFGLIARRFGSVTALAPPTMAIVNANPSNPDLFQDLDDGDKFKIFAASLTQSQWQALTSERGLGLSDLTDDHQRAMFSALFPKRLSVQPRPVPGQNLGPDSLLDVTNDLPLARLRFGQRMDLMAPTTDHSAISLGDFYKPSGPAEYILNSPPDTGDQSTNFGVPVREEVPNVLKATPLDWNAKPLARDVSVTGVKTIDDLMPRLSRATGLELYADARWEPTPLMLWNAPSTIPARDIMQALALCLTGTYRPVGPAFVLTADQVGDGTREQVWAEFAEEVRLAREEPINEATGKIASAHSPRDLSWYGDPLAYSPEQTQQAQKSDPRFPRLQLPFAQLTLVQQTAVNGLAAQFKSAPFGEQGGGSSQVDLSGQFTLEARPQVQVILPSLASPVTMDNMSRMLHEIGQVFQPSMADEMAQMRQVLAQRKPKAPPPPVNIPDLMARLAAVPRRAVLAHPRTAADVDALVASMKATGLNQLWLPVFSNGESAFSSPNDILTEALTATKGTDIQVFPMLNLLAWGQAAPAEDRDRTLRGEDTLQDDARLEQRDALIFAAAKQYADMGLYDGGPPISEFGNVRVSPLAPDVSQRLTALVKTLAARPGVAGLVWQDTVSPGYDIPAGYTHDSVGDVAYRTPLGYTDDARLAFLRQTHIDPLDVWPTQFQSSNPNVTLFGYDGRNQTFRAQWNRFRTEADIRFLQTLYQAAQGSKTDKPLILIRQRRDIDDDSTGTPIWLGSWDGLSALLPAFHRAGEDVQEGTSWPEQQDALTQAKAQSRVALLRLAPQTLPTAAWLNGQLKKLTPGKTWDGFVLDLTPRVAFGTFIGISATEHDPLKRLAADMTPLKTAP